MLPARLGISEEIAHAVRHAQEADVLVPDKGTLSTVAQGWVTLEGVVNNPFEEDSVERAVRNMAGIRGVKNKIVVGAPLPEVQDLRQRVVVALQRRPEDTANRLEIHLADGTVTLRGDVHSWNEREAVLAAVCSAPGVEHVVSNLLIVPEVSAYAR